MSAPELSAISRTPSRSSSEERYVKRIDKEIKHAAAIIASWPPLRVTSKNLRQNTKQNSHQIKKPLGPDYDPSRDHSVIQLKQSMPEFAKISLHSSVGVSDPSLSFLHDQLAEYKLSSLIDKSPNRTVSIPSSNSPSVEEEI